MASNVEIARSAHRTFVDRDWDGFLSHLSPDVTWHGSAIVTGQQSYEGREGVRQFLDEVDRLSEEEAAGLPEPPGSGRDRDAGAL